MKSCIYARTCRKERPHSTTSIENQISFAQQVAQRYNLTVESEHIFTDIEKDGALMPTCWAEEAEDSRPALSEMIATIEEGGISHVLVRRIGIFGSSSEVLIALHDFFVHYNITIVMSPEQLQEEHDPRCEFAFSILRPRIQFETDIDRERNAKLRARKEEEVRRLRARISRLETEIDRL